MTSTASSHSTTTRSTTIIIIRHVHTDASTLKIFSISFQSSLSLLLGFKSNKSKAFNFTGVSIFNDHYVFNNPIGSKKSL